MFLRGQIHICIRSSSEKFKFMASVSQPNRSRTLNQFIQSNTSNTNLKIKLTDLIIDNIFCKNCHQHLEVSYGFKSQRNTNLTKLLNQKHTLDYTKRIPACVKSFKQIIFLPDELRVYSVLKNDSDVSITLAM